MIFQWFSRVAKSGQNVVLNKQRIFRPIWTRRTHFIVGKKVHKYTKNANFIHLMVHTKGEPYNTYPPHTDSLQTATYNFHDDVIKWKHFPLYWPFVRGNHCSPVNSPHKGHLRGTLMFSLICAWINGWVNKGEASDLRRHRVHYDVTLMSTRNAVMSAS